MNTDKIRIIIKLGNMDYTELCNCRVAWGRDDLGDDSVVPDIDTIYELVESWYSDLTEDDQWDKANEIWDSLPSGDEFLESDEWELTEDEAKKIFYEISENNEIYIKIIEAQIGTPLSECIITEWSQHWPVIDAEFNLTGEVVTSDDPDWYNYADEAGIWEDEIHNNGWIIDGGYANPPE